MAHHHSSPFVFWAFLLYMVLLLAFLVKNGRRSHGSWLQQHDGDIMLFRRPRALRQTGYLFVGFFVIHCFYFLQTAVSLHRTVFGFVGLPAIILIPACLYMAGPHDVRLDGERRTYERTTGWPWRPQTRIGPLDDFSGICVTRHNSVMLVPRRPERIYTGFPLSGPLPRQAAATLAEDVSRATGLPIVAAPRNVR